MYIYIYVNMYMMLYSVCRIYRHISIQHFVAGPGDHRSIWSGSLEALEP